MKPRPRAGAPTTCGFRLGTGFFALARRPARRRDRLRALRGSRCSRSQKFGFGFWRTQDLGPGRRRVRRAAVHLGHALLVAPRAADRDADRARHRRSSSPSSRPRVLRQPLVFLTELLAAIPSIVYGLWGIFVLVPVVRAARGRHCPAALRQLPLFSGPPLGVGMLAAALILAVMVIPFTSSVAREVLKAVPRAQREARLRARRHALGGDPRGAPLRPHRASSARSCSASAARSARRWR